MVSSARTSSTVALVMVTPIVCSHPSGRSFMRLAKSWLTGKSWHERPRPGIPAELLNKTRGRRTGPSLSTFAVLPPPTPGAGSGNGSPRGSRPPELPAGKRGGWHHDSVYPSFRLTSFAPRAVNFAVECTSVSTGRRRLHRPNYTFRSMPRSQSASAAARDAESVRVASRPQRAKKEAKRLSKRVVLKTDGRYLIYYEKI